MSKPMNFNFGKLLENNTVIMIISLITATLIWYSVESNNPEAEQTIRSIPVVIDIADSAVERLGLEAVTMAEQVIFADVEIIGAKTTVGNITADDILVKARLSTVTGAGTFDLVLEAVDINGKDILIKKVYPETISLRFDHFIEKTLPITTQIADTEISVGYILGKEYLEPSEITVRGPATEMNKLSNAVVIVNLTSPLSLTTSFETAITLQGENGELIESQAFTSSAANTTVTLPVFKKKTLPITFGFSNIPAGFDTNTLNYSIDPEEIEIAGPVTSVDNLTELNLGYIDLSNLDLDKSFDYETPLPTGYISVEGIQNINITFDSRNYTEKILSVSDIRLINVPADYNIATRTKTISNVIIYGPDNHITNLTDAHLVAQIDMSSVDLKVGTATVPVSILIPGFNSCWAYGNEYTAVIDVTEK